MILVPLTVIPCFRDILFWSSDGQLWLCGWWLLHQVLRRGCFVYQVVSFDVYASSCIELSVLCGSSVDHVLSVYGGGIQGGHRLFGGIGEFTKFRHRDGDTVHGGVEGSLFRGNMLRDFFDDGIRFFFCLGNGCSESGVLACLGSRFSLIVGDLCV